MTAQSYTFHIGEFTCAVLLDTADMVGVERMLKRFPLGTEAEYRQAYENIGLSLDTADTSMNILLIRAGDQTVLVDSGQRGHLIDSLQTLGISPEDITIIILTHTHGDHVLGLMTEDGHSVFPRASFVISAPELTFWEARIAQGLGDQAPILAILRAQGLRVIDLEAQILPGIQAVSLIGHTPGQIGLMIESGGERLLHLADALHSPMQFARPDWSAYFDSDTSQSVPTRRRALQMAADTKALTLFYHLTFPGLGRVEVTDSGFVWRQSPTD